MAGFVQIIEVRTSRIKEIDELARSSRTVGSPPPTLRPLPTAAMSAQCEGPVILQNLDVMWENLEKVRTTARSRTWIL